jgi:hypothetical protein
LREITLLSVISKIFSRIIRERIKNGIETKQRREQAGFRSNRSFVDQINRVRILIEQSNEFLSALYLLLIDSEAFNSTDRDQIWIKLKNYGTPPKIIKLIQESYKNYIWQVIHNGKLSSPIETGTSVKQGCTLSPTIFLVTMYSVMRRTTEHKQRGIQWNLTRKLEDLDFADDTCLLAQHFKDMTGKLVDLNREVRKVGKKINQTKIKILLL